MKLFKKVFAWSSVLVFLLGMLVAPASAAAVPGVTIDGNPISMSLSYGRPFIDSANRMQVPVRAVAEKLGAQVVWDGNTRTATIDGKIKVQVGSANIRTAYGTIVMDTQAVIKGGRVYIPVRSVANAMGYGVTAAAKDGVMMANIITKVDLTVSAAASLKDALAEVKTLYQAEKPYTKLTINFGGSGALQQQIEQGADVDLFVSASTVNMDNLKNKDLLVKSSIVNLLGNKLVLIVPKDSKMTTQDSFSIVTSPSIKKIALGEPSTVPAGKYAEQVLSYLGIMEQIKAKVVYGSDVKQVLYWVETGNVDAGVVYLTDAKVSNQVTVMATASEESHKAIVYPAAVIKASKNYTASKDFVNFMTSAKARAVFEKYGFNVL